MRPARSPAALPSAEDGAENAAHDFPADLRADGARRALRHRLDEAVAVPAARTRLAHQDPAQGIHQAAALAGRSGRAGRRGCRLLASDGAALQLLVRRLAVDGLFVVAVDRRGLDRGAALGFAQWSDAARGREYKSALNDVRPPFLVEQGNQGLAYRELGDGGLHVQLGIGAHRLRRCLDRFLVPGREGAQRVLHAVTELPQHRVGDVQRILRDEVDADALGPDEAHHLLDLLEQRFGRFVEEQVRLVEEEHYLRLVRVADLGQVLEQLREEPQQKRRIEFGRAHQFLARQDVDHALAALDLHQVVDIERRLAEELFPALVLELEQPALDRADRGGRDVAVFGGEVFRVVAHVLEHRAQVLHVEEQEARVVGDLEDQRQHALLGVVQPEHAAQKQRSYAGHGGARRVAPFAEYVPENDRAAGEGEILELERVQTLFQFRREGPRLRQAGKVAFDVRHEHRHADAREPLSERLQGHRLAGPGGPGDQTVAVGERGQEPQLGGLRLGDEQGVGHGFLLACTTLECKIIGFPELKEAAPPWQDIPDGPTSSTRRRRRTPRKARSSRG